MDSLKSAKFYINKALHCKHEGNTDEAELYYSLTSKFLDASELLHKLAMHKQEHLKTKYYNKSKTSLMEKEEEHSTKENNEHCYKAIIMYDVLHENYVDFYNNVVIAANTYKSVK